MSNVDIKTLLRCFFILGLLVIKSTCLLAQSLSVSPSRIFFDGPPGQEVTRQLTLTNSGSQAITFSTSLKDWQRDSVGEKHYFVPGALPHSNALWVKVMPNVVTVLPGSSQVVSVVMQVPQSPAAMASVSRSMLFLTQINEQKAKVAGSTNAAIGVTVKLEFGVHIYYTPELIPNKDLNFITFADRGLKSIGEQQFRRMAIRIRNNGNVVTDGFLRFDITNKETGEEIKVDPKPVNMLPGDEQTVYLDLPAGLKGQYLLVALLDGGEETNLKVAKKEITFNN